MRQARLHGSRRLVGARCSHWRAAQGLHGADAEVELRLGMRADMVRWCPWEGHEDVIGVVSSQKSLVQMWVRR